MNNTFKSILKSLVTMVLMIIFISRFEESSESAVSAIKLCITTVVPSLLPFMAVSTYVLKSGVISFQWKSWEKLSSFLFRLPKESLMIFLMSLTGGFPVGAKLVADGVKSCRLTPNQGKRMLLFCVNPGPAFVINVVGTALLGSSRAGVILLAGVCLASLISGVLSRIFSVEEAVHTATDGVRDSSPLISAVSESINAIISVCAWIVVFSAFLGVVNSLPMEEELKQWINMLAEVTKGCILSAEKFPLSVTALILGWSGLSVHAQLLPYIKTVGLRYRYFAVARIFNGVLSLVITWVLFRIFPCEITVFSNVSDIVPQSVSISVPATIGLLFLSALVILDLAPKRKV